MIKVFEEFNLFKRKYVDEIDFNDYGFESETRTNENFEQWTLDNIKRCEDFKPGDIVRIKTSNKLGTVVMVVPTNKFPILVRTKKEGNSMMPYSQYCDPSELEKYEPKQIFSENDPLGEEDWDE